MSTQPPLDSRCSASGCEVTAQTHPDVMLIPFPDPDVYPPEERHQCVAILRYWEMISRQDRAEPNSYLCDRHFKRDQFSFKGKKWQLLPRRIPVYSEGRPNGIDGSNSWSVGVKGPSEGRKPEWTKGRKGRKRTVQLEGRKVMRQIKALNPTIDRQPPSKCRKTHSTAVKNRKVGLSLRKVPETDEKTLKGEEQKLFLEVPKTDETSFNGLETENNTQLHSQAFTSEITVKMEPSELEGSESDWHEIKVESDPEGLTSLAHIEQEEHMLTKSTVEKSDSARSLSPRAVAGDSKEFPRYCCQYCKFSTVTEYALFRHENSHIKRANRLAIFECAHCGFKAKYKWIVRSHVRRRHLNERNYQCEVCERRFAYRKQLIKHQPIHTGDKPFSCDMCDFSSHRKSSLIHHQKRHGTKRFFCELCDYSSAVSVGELMGHMKRVHTPKDERPLACTECSYRTCEKQKMTRHMLTHTGEKPYGCTICSYRTNQRSNLKVHMKVHGLGKIKETS